LKCGTQSAATAVPHRHKSDAPARWQQVRRIPPCGHRRVAYRTELKDAARNKSLDFGAYPIVSPSFAEFPFDIGNRGLPHRRRENFGREPCFTDRAVFTGD
jgi:hypothetical protein